MDEMRFCVVCNRTLSRVRYILKFARFELCDRDIDTSDQHTIRDLTRRPVCIVNCHRAIWSEDESGRSVLIFPCPRFLHE